MRSFRLRIHRFCGKNCGKCGYPTMQESHNWGSQLSETRGMFMGTPEIYFTKRMDNSRVVRVVDPKRRREMLYFGGMLSLLFLVVMVYLLQHLSAIQYG